MRHNSVVSSYPKCTGIPWVDRLLTGPLGLGRHKNNIQLVPETSNISSFLVFIS